MPKNNLPDIDIDMKNRVDALEALGGTPASIIKDGKITKHNTGVYYTRIPTDPLTGFAALDYKDAEARGYFKIDFLNLGVYEGVQDEQHLIELAEGCPNYERLWHDEQFVRKIIHISEYFELLERMRPTCIKEMAMFLAIIRPGKKHLKYRQWDVVESAVWDTDDTEGYVFKKSHATSYAMVVAVHMNLIEEQENEV